MKYQLLLIPLSLILAAFFLLLALFGWNTLPLAAITGMMGLIYAVGWLFGVDPDDRDGIDGGDRW